MNIKLFRGRMYSMSWVRPVEQRSGGATTATAEDYCSFELRKANGVSATFLVGSSEQLKGIVARFPASAWMEVYLSDEDRSNVPSMPCFLQSIKYGGAEGIVGIITPGLPIMHFRDLASKAVKTLLHPLMQEATPRQLYLQLRGGEECAA